MISSRLVVTVDNPIPSWKGPLENGIPEILVLVEDAPPISGAPELDQIDIYDAITVNKDARIGDKTPDNNIAKFEVISGTKYDDQERSF